MRLHAGTQPRGPRVCVRPFPQLPTPLSLAWSHARRVSTDGCDAKHTRSPSFQRVCVLPACLMWPQEVATPSYVLTWLRYSVFLPMYPLGVASELTMAWLALPTIKATGLWALRMPNKINFAFDYYVACWLIIALYLPGEPPAFTRAATGAGGLGLGTLPTAWPAASVGVRTCTLVRVQNPMAVQRSACRTAYAGLAYIQAGGWAACPSLCFPPLCSLLPACRLLRLCAMWCTCRPAAALLLHAQSPQEGAVWWRRSAQAKDPVAVLCGCCVGARCWASAISGWRTGWPFIWPCGHGHRPALGAYKLPARPCWC